MSLDLVYICIARVVKQAASEGKPIDKKALQIAI